MNKNLYCVFNSYPDREYPIVIDSVFNDEFSETLDSASITITQVKEDKRLSSLQVKSEIVYIYDKDTSFSKYMVVNSYVEQNINIKDNVYKYTIELMSLTKLLETIQCPNLVITHSLVSGQESISKYIIQYMEVYTPKIKKQVDTNKWAYRKLIQVDTELIENKFNKKCRDLAFTNNTLREVLTTLMIQQQCIPTLEVRSSTGEIYLSWLDLNTDRTTFKKVNSINYIQKSMASDSYVNNLVYMQDNVLDDDNSVITENIGFRDYDNAILKQTSNYKLYTTYPIYSINSVKMKLPTNTILRFKPALCKNAQGSEDTLTLFINPLGSTYPTVQIWLNTEGASQVYGETVPTVVFTSGTFYYRENQNLIKSETKVKTNVKIGSHQNILSDGELDRNLFDVNKQVILFATYYIVGYEDTIYSGLLTNAGDSGLTYNLYNVLKCDITQNVVERSKRNLLETDFTKVQNVSSLTELAEFYYGTVYYTIGSNVIQGFSETYNLAFLWWKDTYTLLENMVNIATSNDKSALKQNCLELLKYIFGEEVDYIDFISDDSSCELINVDTNAPIYFNTFFEISYQPLNTLRLEISKEKDIPFNVSQFDSSSNSISNLEFLGIAGQEKVNRFGNEVLAIHQRTTNYDEIQPLNSVYDDNYIVFKRTIDYSYGAYVVNYICAKDYILKNYFTSIETKYRAYEYISYGSTTIRKENTHIYARIDTTYYDGDDYIYWGNKKNKESKELSYLLLSSLLPYSKDNNKYIYKIATTGDNYGLNLYKSDLSIATFNKTMVFNTQLFDSVSYGVWVNYKSEYMNKVGGVPQQWYMNNEDRNYISIAFNTSDFIEENIVSVSKTTIQDYAKSNYTLPLVNEDSETFYDNIMYVVDNNKSQYIQVEGKTFYLDQSEVLNYTLQVDFYTTNELILFNSNLINYCILKQNSNLTKYIYSTGNPLDTHTLNEEGYTDISGKYLTLLTSSNVSVFDDNKGIRIKLLNKKLLTPFKIVCKDENDVYYDLFAYNGVNARRNYVDIYLTLNDTRSDKVGSYVDVNNCKLLTFEKLKVKTNNLQREIEKV